jgi:anaerobic magnesium-protoporphyrin IX monomethyl ester cyclase
MRICLIDPPGIVKGLNAGLGYLASSLIQGGHQVKVLDLNNNTRNIEERLNKIRDSDIIGISVKSSTAQISHKIAETIGRKDLICGGAHITIDGPTFLKTNANFKLGVIGEGEQTTIELMNAIESGLNLRDVKGIIFREGEEIIVNPRRHFICDLDSLPNPNYEIFDSFNGTIVHYPLVTSRGCPHNCIYCCVGEVSGRKWRRRTPERLIEELEHAKSKYSTISFEIIDDNFTLDLGRAKKFCQLLIERRVNMKWACYNGIRADRLDEELVALMKESGCKIISIGVESLDNDVFNRIGKGETLDDIRWAINLLNRYKIEVEGSFIIGLPGDDLKKTIASIQLCKEMHLNKTVWNLFVPYPGTRAWDWVNTEAKILRDWTEGFHFGTEIKPVFETQGFTEMERIHAYRMANINCRGYFALINAEKSLIANAFNITQLILKYDARNVASHIFHLLKTVVEARHRIREYSINAFNS